ncbi:MAG: AI-2E family transporter YdiK [Deltaproteobacteria bacterium]|nr:AI-2E family transporter YdiK [Deltaproteobacteria bacterium]
MPEMPTNRTTDLVRLTLQMLALGALIAASFWIVRPFVVAAVWATTVAVATWPILLWTQSWLGGRRSLAVAVMTIALTFILIAPLYIAVITIEGNVDQITGWSKWLVSVAHSGPPHWIEAIPLLGPRVAAYWRELAGSNPGQISDKLLPWIRTLGLWFLSQVGNLGLLLLQFLLTVIIAAILYANGEAAARSIRSFLGKLVGPEGVKAVELAALAVRSVALGIVVTAIVQSVAAGIGLAIVGVPFAAFLTALIFVLAIAQIGPVPVLIGAVIWTYSTNGVLWGTGLLVWSIFCGTFDNVLRPLLIKRGADLPLLLIFAGVIGGLIGFGVIGLFIGPVVLAVAYTLLVDWVSEGEMVSAQANPADTPE